MASEWTECTLGDLGKVVTGKTPLKSVEENFGDEIPFVTPRDLDGTRIVKRTERFLSEQGAQSVNNARIPANSVLVSCIGSDMGKAALIKEESVTNQQINSIIVDTKFDYNYIYYVLSTRKQEIRDAAGGSAQPILNKTHFSQLDITLPPLPEQKAIAHILGSLDDKIELNRRMNETLEGMAQALFKSWFVDFDPVIDNVLMKNMEEFCSQNTSSKQPSSPLLPGGEEPFDAEQSLALWERLGEGAFKGIPDALRGRAETRKQVPDLGTAASELPNVRKLFPDSFQTSELGPIPTGWEVGRLDDILKQRVERVKASEKTAEVPYIPIECISPKSLFLENVKDGSEAQSSLTKFYEGDILFGAMRPYFHKVCIAPFDGTTRTTAFVLTCNDNSDLAFGTALVNQKSTIDFATLHSEGSTIPYAKWKNSLERMPIVLPPSDLRVEYGDKVGSLLDSIPPKFYQNVTLTKLRDTLLPKLISGEMRIEDAEKIVKGEG